MPPKRKARVNEELLVATVIDRALFLLKNEKDPLAARTLLQNVVKEYPNAPNKHEAASWIGEIERAYRGPDLDRLSMMDVDKLHVIEKVRDFLPMPVDDAAMLEKDMRASGRVEVPLEVTQDGYIIKGYQRYTVAKKIGMESVPCIVRKDILSNEVDKILTINLMDNIARRQLDKETREKIIVQLATTAETGMAKKGRPKKEYNPLKRPLTLAELAKKTAVSKVTVKRATGVNGPPREKPIYVQDRFYKKYAVADKDACIKDVTDYITASWPTDPDSYKFLGVGVDIQAKEKL